MSEETTQEQVVIEGKMSEFVDWIEGISVLELSRLVKVLENRLGVTATAPAIVAATASAEESNEGGVVEQSEFEVILSAVEGSKIQVIKELRAITGLGLKEAKAVVDSVPSSIKAGISKEDAESMKEKLQAVGASVELK